MNVKEAARKSGYSVPAIYKQIREKRKMGAAFRKDRYGRFVIDGRFVCKKK